MFDVGKMLHDKRVKYEKSGSSRCWGSGLRWFDGKRAM